MANSTLFRTLRGLFVPNAPVTNDEGGRAYARPSREALAQYAVTGCLNTTFYASDARQLDEVLALCAEVSPLFLAKAALYARERGRMKDMPALLLAALSRRDPALMDRVFDRVVDSPRVLRTFVQIVRSGATGRKSLGSAPKRAVRRWLERRTDAAVFAASVGRAPSLADVVRMVHPKPATPDREALYAYLLDRRVEESRLPPVVRQYEAFKRGAAIDAPDVPFQMLTSLPLSRQDWCGIARRASWQTLRMNLNTFARQGVFDTPGMAELVASRVADRVEIGRTRPLPYQLLAATRAADSTVPPAVRRALETAMELAIANVPIVEGRVVVCPDVSGSMRSPLTGARKGATTAVRCVDVAALVAAAILRRNPDTEVLPFENSVVPIRLSPNDTVVTSAERLASIGGGGTAVSAPLALLNRRRAKVDLVVIVSDNQSWVDRRIAGGTATMEEWSALRARNRQARLVLIDLQPSRTTQAVERDDILNVGGFSDDVFDLVAEFCSGRLGSGHWVEQIEALTV